jgi:hypothetical protein
VLEVLNAAKTTEAAVDHDGKARAQGFALLHAAMRVSRVWLCVRRDKQAQTAGGRLSNKQGYSMEPQESQATLKIRKRADLWVVSTMLWPRASTRAKASQMKRRDVGSMP